MRFKDRFRRPETLSIAEYWGNLTDPRRHDPTDFRYLVHALDSDSGRGAIFRRKAIERGIGYVAGQTIDLSKKPRHITKAVTKSTSLIDPTHTATWAQAGLILGVPPEDVLITAPLDAGTIHGNRQKVVETLSRRHPTRLSPEELLAESVSYSHNEVVVATGNAAVIGFFTKTDPHTGRVMAPRMTDRLADHAQRMHLPLVSVPVYYEK